MESTRKERRAEAEEDNAKFIHQGARTGLLSAKNNENHKKNIVRRFGLELFRVDPEQDYAISLIEIVLPDDGES